MTSVGVAAGLVGVEALATVVTGTGFVVAALVGHPGNRGVAIVLGCLLTLYGVGVGLTARGIWERRMWARTPALLVQFFGLVVSWYQRHTLAPVAIVVGVLSISAAIAVLRATTPRP
jgi:hypothetical protein